jgi:hypothetical protein
VAIQRWLGISLRRKIGAHGGHGASIGAVCDPAVFTRVVEVAPDVLTRNDRVVVDLVEPGHEPLSWPGELLKKEVFEDATPRVVIRIIRQRLPSETRSRNLIHPSSGFVPVDVPRARIVAINTRIRYASRRTKTCQRDGH